MKKVYLLHKQGDGSFVDWGRHTGTINGHKGEGPAVWYRGEAAEVIELLLKYQKRK